jgi:hypothetical protein
MAIKNLDGLTNDQINRELEHGAKFVIFQFTISIVVMTFRRSSDIYFIRAGESGVIKGLPYTLLNTVLGWWGIPWGPIYTIQSLYYNLSGGKDVTQDVLASVNNGAAAA